MNPHTPTRPDTLGARGRERGAVLIVALVMLIVLTLLALASMNTTSLDEKMAANAQQSAEALQAAETGLTQAFNDPASLDPGATWAPGSVTIPGSGGSFSAQSRFLTWGSPPLGSLYGSSVVQAAHFDIQSTGKSPAGAQVVIHGGVYQIGPKQN